MAKKKREYKKVPGRVRKELWFDQEIIDSLEVKARADNRKLKSYMEKVIIKDANKK